MAKDKIETDQKNYIRNEKSPTRPMAFPTFPKRQPEISNPLGLASATTSDMVPPAAPEAPKYDEGKKLVVGRDIVLNGEISTCDILVVQGKVEASLKQCKTLEIQAGGEFRGTVAVDYAEINGLFDGQLTVTQRLIVRSRGRLTGKIRYAELEVERGGMLAGTMEPSAESKDKIPTLIGKEIPKTNP